MKLLTKELGSMVQEMSTEDNTDAWLRLAAGTPEACIEFINTYCKTLNPDLDPPEVPFTLYDYQQDFIKVLFDALGRKMVHVDKSRQMGLSWVSQAFKLYCLLFVPGFSSLTLSHKLKQVDDGGENSTIKSLFGRIKFMKERLPEWMQKKAGVLFTHARITAEPINPGAFISGEAASSDAARSGAYLFGDWDEMAFTPFARTIRAGWSRSVRGGVYLSTPHGKHNEFARLKRLQAEKLDHVSIHWRKHPVYGAGAYQDDNGRWRSPWYDRETASMTDDEIASELDISYEGSIAGIIYREWRGDFVVSPDIPYESNLPLCFGWDFGKADNTAIIISQFNRDEEHILRAYADNEMLPFQHMEVVKRLLSEIGYRGDYADIQHYADPSGINRPIAQGNSVVREYEALFCALAAGRTVQFSLPRYGTEDGIRTCRRRLKAGRVYVSEQAACFVEAIESYRRKNDSQGNVKDDAEPEHDWSSHPMDAWRYMVTGIFGVDIVNPQRGKLWAAGGRPREQWRM